MVILGPKMEFYRFGHFRGFEGSKKGSKNGPKIPCRVRCLGVRNTKKSRKIESKHKGTIRQINSKSSFFRFPTVKVQNSHWENREFSRAPKMRFFPKIGVFGTFYPFFGDLYRNYKYNQYLMKIWQICYISRIVDKCDKFDKNG